MDNWVTRSAGTLHGFYNITNEHIHNSRQYLIALYNLNKMTRVKKFRCFHLECSTLYKQKR